MWHLVKVVEMVVAEMAARLEARGGGAKVSNQWQIYQKAALGVEKISLLSTPQMSAKASASATLGRRSLCNLPSLAQDEKSRQTPQNRCHHNFKINRHRANSSPGW